MSGLGLIVIAALSAAVAYPLQSSAGQYEDGMDAYLRNDYGVALKLWKPLAENNDVRAQAGMAKLYYAGLGVNQNYAQALFWGEKAAIQGDARAQYVIGTMYRDGSGVPKDLTRALELLLQAAEQNHGWAQYTVGLMYDLGEGIQRDRVEAYKWLALAMVEREGEDPALVPTAGDVLEKVRSKLTPEEIATAKQRVLDWKPAQSR
jgi:uncharacterized protein